MARTIRPTWQRWGRRLAIVPALTLLTVFIVALPSRANIGGFESNDGNLANNGVTDWNDFTSSTPTGYDTLTDIEDNTGNPDNIFAGGTKENDNCPSVNTSGSLGGGNAKFDMTRVYLTHHKATVTLTGGGTATHDFLYLAWERVPSSPTSSAHIAYEFNHGKTLCGAGSDGLYNRTVGDKLIGYDFLGGSNSTTTPTLSVATWDGSAWANQTTLNTAGVSEGQVNNINIGTVTDTIQDPDVTLDPVQFGEAGIDLQAAGIDPCALNGHVTGVSRSSGDSGSAQMKDQVGPAPFTLAACTQNTTLPTKISLDDHLDAIGNFDTPNPGSHTGTLTFKLYGPKDTNCDGKLDSDGTTAVAPVYVDTFTSIASAGPYETGGAGGSNSAASYVVPNDFDHQGVYNWVVTYSGDSANNPSSSGCGNEKVTVDYGLTS